MLVVRARRVLLQAESGVDSISQAPATNDHEDTSSRYLAALYLQPTSLQMRSPVSLYLSAWTDFAAKWQLHLAYPLLW
jgi:hypothetical protein